jgi:Uma2 family endonuclease
MSIVIHDHELASRLIEDRREKGQDGLDEVWNGTYVMSPLANNEHQRIVARLAAVFDTVIDAGGLGTTLVGANISDRRNDWKQNYRVPDLLVFLNNTSAEDCGTHWLGGPDLAVEITSPGEQVADKFDFYASVSTRELIVIDREPWQVTQYQLDASHRLRPVGLNSFVQQTVIKSGIVPVCFEVLEVPGCLRLTRPDGSLLREIPFAAQGHGEKI